MKIINHEVNGLQVSQRNDDGYINLTQMAHANNKDLHDYLRLKTTKAFIQELSLETGIHGSKIIQVRKGRGDRIKQGTWGHPQVAIHCGQWCSAKFAVLVSGWVVQWMTSGQNPISSQSTGNFTDLLSGLEELEKLIISIRSQARAVHTCAHQPLDELLAKSLHSLSHNQLNAIVKAIHQMQTLKQFAESKPLLEPTLTLQPITTSKPTSGLLVKEKRLANINIKIARHQRDWLASTAQIVRQKILTGIRLRMSRIYKNS